MLAGCSTSHGGYIPLGAGPDAEPGDAAAAVDGCPEDVAESALPVEASWGGGIPCGTTTCDPTTHYCLQYVPEGGLSLDAGDLSDRCVPLPPACLMSPTCACVQPMAPCGSAYQGCVEVAGAVAVTCSAG